MEAHCILCALGTDYLVTFTL